MSFCLKCIRSVEAMNSTVGSFASWLIFPLSFFICFDVACRYLFNSPTIWAFDVSYMLYGSYFLLGGAMTLARGRHIREDILFQNFSRRGKALVGIVGFLVLCLPVLCPLTAILGMQAFAAFENNERAATSAWGPPVWPFRFLFFLSFFLLTLQCIVELIKNILIWQSATMGSAERNTERNTEGNFH